MYIPAEIFWPTTLALIGWIVTSIIKHRRSLDHRVTYDQCKENRTDCPCLKALEQINNRKDDSK